MTVTDALDGLISFYASRHAIRAEKTLRRAGLAAELIPGPKHLSPNCGVALRFELCRRDEVIVMLDAAGVEIDEIHEYRPRIDDWARPQGRKARRPWRKS